MKKIVGLLMGVLVVFAMVGCSNTGKTDGEVTTPDVTVNDIMDSIKEQIAQDIKADGFGENQSDEEILQGYMEINLVEEATDDPFNLLFFERSGLDKELLVEGILYAPKFNTNADEIIVLKAENEADAAALKESLQTELDAQIQTWERYLPDQYEKVKNNVLKVEGNYVLYLTYGHVDAVEKIFDEKVK